MLTVVILTFNEEKHVERAIASVQRIANEIVVVDSGSTDQTVEIARNLGAKILTHRWVNHAHQFNWAIDQLQFSRGWILRLDADEIVSDELAMQISEAMRNAGPKVGGMTIARRMTFMGQTIRHGGLFPVHVVRIFRVGRGRCERRWMDEHIQVEGEIIELSGELLDDNLNSISWWIDKHNRYSNLEVIEILKKELKDFKYTSGSRIAIGRASRKRWLKEKVYLNLPIGFRAFLYFGYRYFFRLGFVDGVAGTAFHFLQGFWYRYLVDIKLLEVRNYMNKKQCDVNIAIHSVLGVDLSDEEILS